MKLIANIIFYIHRDRHEMDSGKRVVYISALDRGGYPQARITFYGVIQNRNK